MIRASNSAVHAEVRKLTELWLQAFRDNERIAFQNEAFAEHLWQRSGLADIFHSIDVGSNQTAVGLNPNIRLYRQEYTGS